MSSPDAEDEPLVLLPLLLGGAIALLLLYVCCGPGSAPPTQPKERPHSYSSTRRMVETQSSDKIDEKDD